MPKRTIVLLVCVIILWAMYLNWQHVSFPGFDPSSVPAPLSSLFSLPDPSETITGTPTITVSQINQVLAVAHSPAGSLGTVFYQQGVKFHINPAFALAVFHHESNYGLLGVARITHSIGNIRCTAGWKCDPSGGYRWYPTWTDGVIDFYRVIQDVYLVQKCDTIAKIIPIYAPSSDHNNVATYIQTIRADLARWQQGQV